jgi:prepilin signal peptidase PulO-like enzyme (type II secretory pathway)
MNMISIHFHLEKRKEKRNERREERGEKLEDHTLSMIGKVTEYVLEQKDSICRGKKKMRHFFFSIFSFPLFLLYLLPFPSSLYLFVVTRFLTSKLITWESKDGESSVLVLIVELLKSLILSGESALRSDIHYQNNISLQVSQWEGFLMQVQNIWNIKERMWL